MGTFPLHTVMNKKKRAYKVRLSALEKQRLLESCVYVLNLTDIAWPPVHRTYGVYTVPAKKAAEKYGVLKVTGRWEVADDGDDKAIETGIEAAAIAKDIAREVNENCTLAPDAKSFLGVIVSEKPELSAGEFEKAARELREYQRALVSSAMRSYAADKEEEITLLHRWAATCLGVKAAWLFESEQNEKCRACGKLIPIGAAKCPECHAVLNIEKLKEFYPLEWAAIQEARGGKKQKAAETAKA